MEGKLCKTPPRGGEVVSLAPSCEGGVVYNTSYSRGGVLCPGERRYARLHEIEGKTKGAVDLTGATMKGMRQAKGNL